MSYQAELAFFRRLMEMHHLQTLIIRRGETPEVDVGLRRLLGLGDVRESFWNEGKENTIYFASDAFSCSYAGLVLPGGEQTLVIGPYLKHEPQDTMLMAMLERCHLSPSLLGTVKQFYAMLPLVEEESLLLAVMTVLGETLWGSAEDFAFEYIEGSDSPLLSLNPPTPVESASEAMRVQMIEQRYAGERQLMHAVSHGLHHQAQLIMAQWRFEALEKRTADPIRNMRNYAIILNTLLRKAAEEGHVHPVHIDQLSSSIAHRIETFTRLDDFSELLRSMAHKYCLLVKNHSMQHYSKLIQHVILHIDTDLTADLSLHAHAERFSVNASYLSTLFKKETGSTLTEYVNRARIDHAIFLLNATDMQVQTIAQYCGIPDVNYFTKLFKKLIGKTPKAYRAATRGMGGEHG